MKARPLACAVMVAIVVAGSIAAGFGAPAPTSTPSTPATRTPHCNLQIRDVSSLTWRGARGNGYDVYDPQQRTEPVTFSVKSSGQSCAFFVTVTPQSASGGGPGSLTGPGASLRYYVYKDRNGTQVLKPRSLATPSDVFVGVAPQHNSTTQFQFSMSIPPEQVVLPGQYQDQLEIAAYEGTLQNATLRDRKIMAVNAPVPAVAEISFAGGSFDPNYGSYSLNFNTLTTGQIQAITMRVRGNGGYRIGFQSSYGGLRPLHGSSADVHVPYTMSIDGAAAVLPPGATVQLIVNTVPTPAAGEDYRLEFEIGDIRRASAGDYRDIINLTVSSLR